MKKLFFLLALLFASPALATQTLYFFDGIAGYQYTNANGTPGVNCGTNCKYLTATFTIPTPTNVSGASNDYGTQWIAITGGGGNLAQFGFEQKVTSGQSRSYFGFFELFPVDAGLTQVTQGQFAHTGGDRVRLTMTCTSNCTDNNASTTFTLLWENLTQGNSFSVSKTWQVVFAQAEFVTEALNPPSGGVMDSGILRFTDIKMGPDAGSAVPITFAYPGGGTTATVGGQLHINVLPVSGTTRANYPSPPFGNSFSVCYVTPKWVTNTQGPCDSRPYSGQQAGFGP